MVINPICSVYGIFIYIYPTTGPNVGKYTIHGASGNISMVDFFPDGSNFDSQLHVLQWDEGGRHPATSLWKNCDAVGGTRNWNHHFAQQIKFPCWVSLFCFYQDSATGGGWGCTSLPWWWPQFSAAQINYCELRPVWKKRVNVPLTRWAAVWIQHTNILFAVVFWYGEVDHCTNLAPPFFLWWLRRKSRGWPFR